MIRTKDKIFGEANDPNTVIASDVLSNGWPIVGAGNKGLKRFTSDGQQILYTGESGQLLGFNVSAGKNKWIGTDSNGNLVFKDPPAAPNFQFGQIKKITSSHSGLTITTPNTAGLAYAYVFEITNTTGTWNNSDYLNIELYTPITVTGSIAKQGQFFLACHARPTSTETVDRVPGANGPAWLQDAPDFLGTSSGVWWNTDTSLGTKNSIQAAGGIAGCYIGYINPGTWTHIRLPFVIQNNATAEVSVTFAYVL